MDENRRRLRSWVVMRREAVIVRLGTDNRRLGGEDVRKDKLVSKDVQRQTMCRHNSFRLLLSDDWGW